MAKLFYVGIKGLIWNDKKEVLLLKADITKHRKNTEPYWDIPGGRIEEGQSVQDTLQREIEEETGVTDIGVPVFLTSVVSNHQIPIDDTKWAGLVLMVYKVTIPADSKIVISKEHTAFEWVDKKAAKERLKHKYPAEFTDAL